jgi:hypothetical protein
VAAIAQAARDLSVVGLVLEEDVGRCEAAAEGWDSARHVVTV